jgi:hypothetical protein
VCYNPVQVFWGSKWPKLVAARRGTYAWCKRRAAFGTKRVCSQIAMLDGSIKSLKFLDGLSDSQCP